MPGMNLFNNIEFFVYLFLVLVFALLAARAYYVTLRFNLHMLQLNGYDNEEHGTWLKNNRGKQRQLIFMLICGVMMAVYSAPVTAAISILFLIIVNDSKYIYIVDGLTYHLALSAEILYH